MVLIRTLLKGVQFVGATLWTDYALYGEKLVGDSMNEAQRVMNDHRLITRDGTNLFLPEDAAAEFRKSKEFINNAVQRADGVWFKGPTVVVTHHAPHPHSIAPQYKGDKLSPAFVSDLSDVIKDNDIALWVHGHDHNNHDYTVDGTRIVSSQKGYPGEHPDWKVLNIEI